MARHSSQELPLLLAGTKYEGLVPDVHEDIGEIMVLQRQEAVRRVHSMSNRYGRLVSRLMRAAVEGKDPYECIMEWQSQAPDEVEGLDTQSLPASLVSRLDAHTQAVRENQKGGINQFTKEMEDMAKKYIGGINESIRRAEERHAERVRIRREMSKTTFEATAVTAGTELDRDVGVQQTGAARTDPSDAGAAPPPTPASAAGDATGSSESKRNKKPPKPPLKDDSAYRRILAELRRANLFASTGLGAPELTVLRSLSSQARGKYRDRVAEKLLGRARRFVRRLRQVRRRMQRSDVFGPRANAARLRSMVDVSARSAFGAVSVQRARRDVLQEMGDERAFVRALGGPERKAALERALDGVFEGTKWEGVTRTGASRLRASGLHDVRMSRTRRAHAAVEHFLDKLRDRARETKAKELAEEARGRQAATAHRRASAVVDALKTAMAARLAQEPAEKDMHELMGESGDRQTRVVTGRGRSGAGEGVGEAEDVGPLGRGRSRFPRTIDPDRRSQPRWINSGRLDRFDRLQGRLWAQEHGIVDEASALMTVLPPELRRVVGTHLPRKPDDVGGEALLPPVRGGREDAVEALAASASPAGATSIGSGGGAKLSSSAASAGAVIGYPGTRPSSIAGSGGRSKLGTGGVGAMIDGAVGPVARQAFRPSRREGALAVAEEEKQGGSTGGASLERAQTGGRRGSVPLELVGRARNLSFGATIAMVAVGSGSTGFDSSDSEDGRDTPGASDLDEGNDQPALPGNAPDAAGMGDGTQPPAGFQPPALQPGQSQGPPQGITPMFWSPVGQPSPGTDPLGLTDAAARSHIAGGLRTAVPSEEELKEQEEALFAQLPAVSDPSAVYDVTRSVFKALPPIAGPRRKRAVDALRTKMRGAFQGPGEEASLVEEQAGVVSSQAMARLAASRQEASSRGVPADALEKGRGLSAPDDAATLAKGKGKGASQAPPQAKRSKYELDAGGSTSGARLDVTTHLGESLLGVEETQVTGGWARLLEGDPEAKAGTLGASDLAVTQTEARNFHETDEFLPLLQMKAFASGMPRSSTATAHNVLAPTYDALDQSAFKRAATLVPGRSEGGAAPGIASVVLRTRRELKQLERDGRTKGRRVGAGGTLQALQFVKDGAETLRQEREKADKEASTLQSRLREGIKLLASGAGAGRRNRAGSTRDSSRRSPGLRTRGASTGTSTAPTTPLATGGVTSDSVPAAGQRSKSPVQQGIGGHRAVRARETLSAMGLRQAAQGRLSTPRDAAERNRLGPRWFEQQFARQGLLGSEWEPGEGALEGDTGGSNEVGSSGVVTVGADGSARGPRLRVSSAGGFLEGVARQRSPDGTRPVTPMLRGRPTAVAEAAGGKEGEREGPHSGQDARREETKRDSKRNTTSEQPGAAESRPTGMLRRVASFRQRVKTDLEVEMEASLRPEDEPADSNGGDGAQGEGLLGGGGINVTADLNTDGSHAAGSKSGLREATSQMGSYAESESARSIAADSLSSSASAALLGLQVGGRKGKRGRRRNGAGGRGEGVPKLRRAAASMAVLEDRRAMSRRLPLRRRTRVVVSRGNPRLMDPTLAFREVRPPQEVEQPLTRAQKMALEKRQRQERAKRKRSAAAGDAVTS